MIVYEKEANNNVIRYFFPCYKSQLNPGKMHGTSPHFEDGTQSKLQNLQDTRLVKNKARIHYNNIFVKRSTCHLWELNMGGEDNNHSS
jgi:hypothetical protein